MKYFEIYEEVQIIDNSNGKITSQYDLVGEARGELLTKSNSIRNADGGFENIYVKIFITATRYSDFLKNGYKLKDEDGNLIKIKDVINENQNIVCTLSNI